MVGDRGDGDMETEMVEMKMEHIIRLEMLAESSPRLPVPLSL